MYELTDEGERYLRDGLPEENLIRRITSTTSIKKAKQKIKNFDIAVQWAKKKGWMEIKNGKIYPIEKPKNLEFPEEEALEKVNRGKKISEELAKTLLQRKLIQERKEPQKPKKLEGKTIRNLTPELIKTGLWREVNLKPYNVEATGEKIHPGKRQPYNRFLSQVRNKLVQLGFKEMTGPTIETEFWNFDALYQAQDHPSRDWAQTYTLKEPKRGSLPSKKIVHRVKKTHEDGWKTGSTGWGYKWSRKKASRLMPRAHGTVLSARTLAQLKKANIPGKYFAIARCYRPDVIDATHGVEFNQCEGIIVEESLDFKKMLGILKMMVQEITGLDRVKFRPDYFPFTEPSLEVSVKHPEMGWVELAGAGIFREELTRPLGVEEPVIAWGFGIDRLAMVKLNIEDIRELFSQNLEWLRGQEVLR